MRDVLYPVMMMLNATVLVNLVGMSVLYSGSSTEI